MNNTYHPSSPKFWGLDLSLLALLIGLLFALWLGAHALLVPDEGRYSEVAREMVASHNYIVPRANGVAFLDKPALYYWLQASAIHMFGLNEWSLRFWPALFGLLGCLGSYVAGRILFDRRSGILAALVLATCPLYFCIAHYANLDLEVAVLISLSLYSFIISMKLASGAASKRFLWASYLFAALAVLTKGLIGIVFPAMIIGVWILCLNRWHILKRMHLLAGLLLIFAINAPWYFLLQDQLPQFFHYFFVKEQFSRFLTKNFNDIQPIWFYLPIVIATMFPWAVFLIQAIVQKIKVVSQDKRAHQTELFLLLWPLIIFIFFSFPASKTVGYIVPVFPPLALLIGNYLSNHWGKIQQKGVRRGLWVFVLVAVIMVVACAVSLHMPSSFASQLHMLVGLITSVAVFFTLAGIGVLLTIRRGKLSIAFVLMFLAMALTLLAVMKDLHYAGLSSSKSVALTINHYKQPGDEVATYKFYNQDFPLYNQNPVTVVADWASPSIAQDDDWRNQLWEGMQFEGKKDWLVDEQTFWQRWNSDKRLFVLVYPDYLAEFKSKAGQRFYLVKPVFTDNQNADQIAVVVSNQGPCF